MVNKRKLHEHSDRFGVVQDLQAVDTGLCALHPAIHSSERIHNLILDALCQLLPLVATVVVPNLCPLCHTVARIAVDGDKHIGIRTVGS